MEQPPSPPNTTGTENFSFLFPKKPNIQWTGGTRYFGAKRGKRVPRSQAGYDPEFSQRTKIYAIADEKRVRRSSTYTTPNSDPPYRFTAPVEIVRGPILVRHGEIETDSYVGGEEGKQGQVIAKVGALKMLHFEVCTDAEDLSGLNSEILPFKRRGDLTAPNPYLKMWSRNLPNAK